MKKVIIGLVLALGLGGLAVTANGGLSWVDSLGLRGQERLVKSRIENYWQARMDEDVDGMSRFVHPLQQSVAQPGMLVTESFELGDVTIDGDSATAQLTVKHRLRHPVLSSRDRTVELNTRWVRYEGKWYRDVTPVGMYEAIKSYRGEWISPTEEQAN